MLVSWFGMPLRIHPHLASTLSLGEARSLYVLCLLLPGLYLIHFFSCVAAPVRLCAAE